MHSKGEVERGIVIVCNVEWCQSILCWKLLVKLVKDAVDNIHKPQQWIPRTFSVFVCVCLLVCDKKHRWVKHNCPLWLGPYQSTLPCERDKDTVIILLAAKRTRGHDTLSQQQAVGRHWPITEHLWLTIACSFLQISHIKHSSPLIFHLVFFFLACKGPPVDNTRTKPSTAKYNGAGSYILPHRF